MESTAPNPALPPLEVHASRASSVITQVIPEGSAEAFLQWQRGICAAAAEAPGYQTTEIYPPATPGEPWVVLIHFDNPATLKAWMDSPRRAEWVARLPVKTRDFHLKTLPKGFGAYLAGLSDSGLPHWKMFLYVLVGLYPTVMLLNMFVLPPPDRFGLAATILLGNVCSCTFLEWVGSRFLTRLLGPWLRANGPEGRTLSLLGAALIVTALVVMMFLFRLASS